MKLLLGLCLLICFVGVHCVPTNPHAAECMAESKVDMQTLMDIERTHLFPDTRELKCYLACMMKKNGMLNADGTFTKIFLERDHTQKCRNLGGKDTCEVAYKATPCLINTERPKHN